MTDQQTGLVVLTLMSLACATASHTLIRNYWVATLLAGLGMALCFEVIARAMWDQMFLHAWATGGVAGLIAGAAVGLIFRRLRRKRPASSPVSL